MPRLRPDQQAIIAHPARIKVVAMGRRWGKSYMAGTYALACADLGGAVAWVVPTYKNARPTWRFVEAQIGHASDSVSTNKTERMARFPSGGWLGVYTADNDVALRGESFDVVIVDEASRVSEQTYQDVIIPTLADRDGRIVLISTPNARNWFYTEWARGKADGARIASWQAPTSDNPNPNIKRAFDLARETLPDRTFRQEWLAEFVEGSGAVFRRIRECARSSHDAPDAHDGHRIVFGVDWGQQNDYTAIAAYCGDCRRMVALDRFNQVSWTIQRGRLAALAAAWKPQTIIAESNSIGAPLIEALQAENLPVVPFETTAASKPPLIQSLVLAFEQGAVNIIADAALIAELEAYEESRNAVTGRVSYSAPSGGHDDTVMALALAWRAANEGTAQIETIRNSEYSISAW